MVSVSSSRIEGFTELPLLDKLYHPPLHVRNQAKAPNKAEQKNNAITPTTPVETFVVFTAAPELVLDALVPVAVPVPVVEPPVFEAVVLLTAAVAVAFSPLLQNGSPPLLCKHVSSTDTF